MHRGPASDSADPDPDSDSDPLLIPLPGSPRPSSLGLVLDLWKTSLNLNSNPSSISNFNSNPNSNPNPNPNPNPNSKAPILSLPAELIDTVFSHLDAHDLLALGASCSLLRKHAYSDMHWHRCVQENVPGVKVTGPGPCTTFRHLWLLHDRLWFLPKFKIWFCDRDLAGKLIVARFDPRRGCIEAYQLVAVSNHDPHAHALHHLWPGIGGLGGFGGFGGFDGFAFDFGFGGNDGDDDGNDDDDDDDDHHDILAHAFEPRLRLHLDKPVLQFRGRAQDGQVDEFCHMGRGLRNRYAAEIPMALEDRLAGMFRNFLLARPLDADEAERRIDDKSASDSVWPPPAIPAPHRVSGARPGQSTVAITLQDCPVRRSHVSDRTFRIRQWIELAGTPSSPVYMRHGPGVGGVDVYQLVDGDQQQHIMSSASSSPSGDDRRGPPEIGHMGVHIGEEIITYATLDPELYTPTPLRPWRGIWVGDYSGHGCEFILIHQPDDEPVTDDELGLVRRESETDSEWELRRADARIYRGRLEAIKLTGDPNVPRGEYTFIADDMGLEGHIGVVTEHPFGGARVVRSRGHIAATGFLHDKYIDCRLIILGYDKLALYWIELAHLSYFHRVNIDQYLTP